MAGQQPIPCSHALFSSYKSEFFFSVQDILPPSPSPSTFIYPIQFIVIITTYLEKIELR
jgi:hypothetical protein